MNPPQEKPSVLFLRLSFESNSCRYSSIRVNLFRISHCFADRGSFFSILENFGAVATSPHTSNVSWRGQETKQL